MTGVLDRFFVALGFQVDPKGIAQLRGHVASAKSSILSLGTAIRGAIGGFAVGAMVKGIASIGSEFESNRIAIAGFLSALGISSDFNKGLKDADQAMTSIITAAAKLPGEANEYIHVFKAGVPVLAKALPGAGIKELSDFTNMFTALGKTLGVDAPQIGRDLNLMMGPIGRAGGQVRTFQEMIPFLQQLEGHANLTAASFNKMSQPERIKILKDVLANPNIIKMIESMSSSFDAMWGAAKSAFTMITRLATKPLFEGMKKGLDNLNAAFFDANGKITALGQGIVDAGKSFGKYVVQIGHAIAWLGEFKGVVLAAKVAVMALVLWMLGPWALIAIAIALVVEDIYQFQKSWNSAGDEVETITGRIVKKIKEWTGSFEDAFTVIKAVGAGIAAAMVALAAKMAVAWIVGMFPLVVTLVAIAAIVTAAYELWANWKVIVSWMRDEWQKFKDDLGGNLLRGLASGIPGLGPILRVLDTVRGAREGVKLPGYGGAAGPEGVIWTDPSTGIQDTYPAGFVPPSATMSGADAAGASWDSSRSSTTNITAHVNVKSTDPVQAGKETAKALAKLKEQEYRSGTRNAQSGTAG